MMQVISPDAIDYLPVLLLLVFGASLAAVMLGLSALMGSRKYNKAKYSVYECGVPEVGDARQQFSVRYYLIAIVFLLFDVEVVFLYPWAVVYKEFLSAGAFVLIEMCIFIAILLIGYFYLIRKKAFDWQ